MASRTIAMSSNIKTKGLTGKLNVFILVFVNGDFYEVVFPGVKSNQRCLHHLWVCYGRPPGRTRPGNWRRIGRRCYRHGGFVSVCALSPAEEIETIERILILPLGITRRFLNP
jgi:hypothetical protein